MLALIPKTTLPVGATEQAYTQKPELIANYTGNGKQQTKTQLTVAKVSH